ncbi:MAG: Carbohydrate binding family 6 [Phycisphaerales bacterium]|nr:Carbohydrate binding family 6 [Phycisphaerales bacterium]
MAVGSDWYTAGTSSSEGREWRLVQRPLGKIEVHLSEATPGATTAAYVLDTTSGVTPYLDTNNNGVLDVGEPTGVYDASAGVNSFLFTGLQAGHYPLRLSVPAGTQFVAGPGNGTFDTNVEDRPSWIYIPYTLRIRKTLTAYLFNDTDGDNVRDAGEAALSGRTVFLDTDQDGVLDVGETSLVTDANGLAAFNVYDGTYQVRQIVPTGWRFTQQAATIVNVRAYTNLSVPLGSIPATPTDPASVSIEAETGTFAGGTAKSSGNTGYTGTGYADFGGQNSSAEWSVTRNGAGQVSIDFRYANGGTTDRPLILSVNGTVISTLAFAPTGSWTTWKSTSVTAALVAGTNTIKLVSSAAVGGGNVDSLTINTNATPTPPAWLSVPAGATWSLVGNLLTISGGAVIVLSDAGASVAGLNIVVNSGAQIVFNTTQHLGTLTVNGTATMAAGGRLLRVAALALNTGASLDLADNDLILESTATTSAAALQQWLLSGRSGGTWTGAGLRSSSAATNGRRTFALARAAEYFATVGAAAAFHGEAIGSTAVVLKYVYAGDATLDGKVDFNDFLSLQNHFNAANAGFVGGDFDYSGTADFNDFLILQNNFGQTTAGVVNAAGATASPATPAALNTASLSGIAFNDANRNGKYDKGDSLAAGKTLWLDLDDDGIKDSNEPSAVTDADGRYTFKNLSAGTYRVRRLFPAGYIESTPAAYITLTVGQAVGDVRLGSK